MEREVRYCTSDDGTHIAYSVEGQGPALFITPYITESFALDHLIPEYEAFNEELGRGRQVIRADLRGCGLSQRDAKEISGDLFCSATAGSLWPRGSRSRCAFRK
jgi:pimeloyl-ACP methyl ester carboxylesterase